MVIHTLKVNSQYPYLILIEFNKTDDL